jgi:23S rRNA pseudouridine1911/1915/1917 synthase
VNIPIVFEDDWLLVVDKPSGLLTIPTVKNESRTLTSILNEDAEEKGALYRLHPCHRLDRETSGLIIYAKGKSIQKKMMDMFKAKKVEKKYLAFVQGDMFYTKGQIKNRIERLEALTIYSVLERKKDFCIVEAQPLTGRTNQLRIHFKQIGHPILGDVRFAFRRDFIVKAKRLCLHAGQLRFTHPVTGKDIQLTTELPKDLKEFIERHKND